ncbi:hypothetical protein ACET3Z_005806 [Daucus carota]
MIISGVSINDMRDTNDDESNDEDDSKLNHQYISWWGCSWYIIKAQVRNLAWVYLQQDKYSLAEELYRLMYM